MSSPAAVSSAYDELNEIPATTYVVGNAGDEVVERQVSGIFYRFEPSSKTVVKDRYDYVRNDKGQIPRNKLGEIPIGAAKEVPKGGDARTILTALFSDEPGFRAGDAGLYLLRNDGRDDLRYKVARDKYLASRVERASRLQNEWTDRCMRLKPGELPPVMPQHIRDEINFLAKHKAGVVNRKRYISRLGDFESDVRDEVAAHLRMTYPALYDAQGDTMIVDRDNVIPHAPKTAAVPANLMEVAPVAPAAQPVPDILDEEDGAGGGMSAEARFVLDMVEKLDYRMSAAEITGVMDGTGIEAVMERLAPIEAERRKNGGK